MKQLITLFGILSILFANTAYAENIQLTPSIEQYTESIDMDDLLASETKILVLDSSKNAYDEYAFTREEIAFLQDQGKVVLASLTLTEAEIWRFYWNDQWEVASLSVPCYETYIRKTRNIFDWRRCNTDLQKPQWLGPQNPRNGKYRVRYWQQDWFEDALLPSLERIASAGFDGVYLETNEDIGFWKSSTGNSKYSVTFLTDQMMRLVSRIKNNGMQFSGQNEFFVTIDIADFLLNRNKKGKKYRHNENFYFAENIDTFAEILEKHFDS